MTPFSITTAGSIDLDALAVALAPRLAALNPTSPPPVVTPPPTTGVFWVYYNGQFNWAGDFSFDTGPINYQDTAGVPLSGQFDIAVPIVSKFGGYQPFAPGAKFDTTPYNYLIVSLKPTNAGAIFATGFAAVNDQPDGVPVTFAGPGITQYGPVPVPGQWGSYKIPLKAFNLTQPILKFSIAAAAGIAPDLFYVDNLGFSV